MFPPEPHGSLCKEGTAGVNIPITDEETDLGKSYDVFKPHSHAKDPELNE